MKQQKNPRAPNCTHCYGTGYDASGLPCRCRDDLEPFPWKVLVAGLFAWATAFFLARCL